MSFGAAFVEFFYRIAIGAGVVLTLLLIVQAGIRRRSQVAAIRRKES